MKSHLIFTGLSLAVIVTLSHADLILGIVVAIVSFIIQAMLQWSHNNNLTNKLRRLHQKEAELFWQEVELENNRNRDKRIGKFMEEDLWERAE